jgi:hypothetical protein
MYTFTSLLQDNPIIPDVQPIELRMLTCTTTFLICLVGLVHLLSRSSEVTFNPETSIGTVLLVI